MPPPFDVETERRDDVIVLALVGELDLTGQERCLTAIRAALFVRPKALVIDLNDLQHMDSSGLRALLYAKDLAEEAGVSMGVLNGAGPPHRLISLTGIDREFVMIDDPSELEPPAGQPS